MKCGREQRNGASLRGKVEHGGADGGGSVGRGAGGWGEKEGWGGLSGGCGG